MISRTRLLFFTGICFFVGCSAALAARPVLLFSDMTDAPVSGWEGSTTKGAAVTIWARNVGSERADSYVRVGNVNLTPDADYAEWGATTHPMVPLGMRRITFWLNAAMIVEGGFPNTTISITTAGGTSNTIAFHCRPLGSNRIYFLDNVSGNAPMMD